MTGIFSKFKLDRSFGKPKLDTTVSEWMAPRPCDRCRKRRIRCDRDLKECNHCKSSGFKCTYLDVPKKRGPKVKISTDMALYMYLLHKSQNTKIEDETYLYKEQDTVESTSSRYSDCQHETSSNISPPQPQNSQFPLTPLSSYSPQFSTILSKDHQPITAYPYYNYQDNHKSESHCQSDISYYHKSCQ